MSAKTPSRTLVPGRPAVGSAGPSQWRTVDIVVVAVVAAVFGVVYWAWGTFFQASVVFGFFPPLSGFTNAVFVMAGPLAALIVRRPGAALFGELAAAAFEALITVQWSATSVLLYGAVQGLAAEAAFLALRYRRYGVGAAVLAGALTGIAEGVLDLTLYYTGFSGGWKVAYLAATTSGGIVLAGVLAWLLVRALAATGVLTPFASGRDQKLV